MSKRLEKILTIKNYLLAANVLLVFFLIFFNNLGILPIKSTFDFVFFSSLGLVFALYRPGWAFLFFVGTITLENINLAPETLGLAVRPYQFFGGLALVAVLIRLATKKLNFELPKPVLADYLLLLFALSGFISAIFSVDRGLSLKQSVIAVSFVAFYFLTRIFIQSADDFKRIIPFFLSSSALVVLYGIWQNVRFASGLAHFETMPGRPNATFVEPDWLGMFLVLLTAASYALIYYFSEKTSIQKPRRYGIFSYLLLIACYVLAIITVSRSAWMGILMATILFLFAVWTDLGIYPRKWDWRKTIRIKLGLLSSVVIALSLVYIFNLTNFQLFNRIQSTGTGLQKITITCPSDQKIDLPEKIRSMSELDAFGCWQINLEEIGDYLDAGMVVTEIYRADPNVSIRSEIYQKSWREIKKHPLLGIGWGNVGKILGTDGRGASLNASNIFLEVWLGAGLGGLVSAVILMGIIFFRSIQGFMRGESKNKAISIFVLLGMAGLVIANLFNAGIFLGIVWLFFGIANRSSFVANNKLQEEKVRYCNWCSNSGCAEKDAFVEIDFSSRFVLAAVVSSLFLSTPPEISRKMTSRIMEERQFPSGKEKIAEFINFSRKLQGLEECFI